MHWVVDGMNLIGSRPDGWWRDRPGARRRLVDELASLVGPGVAVTVVFDGRPTAGEAEAAAARGVEARFAPGGPDAADHAIVALVGCLPDTAELVVVTSDGALVASLQRAGVATEGVRAFGARLAGPDPEG